MLHSSLFHFGKAKNMARDCHPRKAAGRHRFRDVSYMKLTEMFKSLRRRRCLSKVPRRYSLTCSGSFPSPLADRDSSLVPPSPSPDTVTRPCYRFYAAGISNATELDCLSGISTSSSGTRHVAEREHQFSPCLLPAFATSPSLFQLRSSSTKDYLVDRLEQHLRQLSLGDASSDLHKTSSCEFPMEVEACADISLLRAIGSDKAPSRARSSKDPKKALSPLQNQNVVPMILITSVDAKHAKPLPYSPQRRSRTPFGPSNVTNTTNVSSTKPKTSHDDPFTTQLHSSVLPPNYNLTFRLPAFPTAYSSPIKHVPETPTPMCCNHVGDCRGDLWEVFHPPLVTGGFTLPPFTLPPLSTGLFGESSSALLPR